MIVDKLLNWK